MNTIHQNQLKGLRYSYLPRSPHRNREQSFNEWLETYVGEFKRDWWRTYDMNLSSPTYGTTWHFKDEKNAMLTLLKWS